MITWKRNREELLKLFTRLTPFFQAIAPNKYIFSYRKKDGSSSRRIIFFFCHIYDVLSRHLDDMIFDRYFINERRGAYLKFHYFKFPDVHCRLLTMICIAPQPINVRLFKRKLQCAVNGS